MASVGIRDLKNNLSAYIRRLKPGQPIIVTDRGRVVAELRAPAGESDAGDRAPLAGRYAELIEAGVIRRAKQRGDPLRDWPTARQVALPPGTVTQLVDEDRGG